MYSRSQAVTAVTDLISTRFYPSRLPDAPTLPAATYVRETEERFSAMGSDGTLRRAVFQLNSFATTGDGARSLGDALQDAFVRFSGTSASVTVQDILLLTRLDFYEDENETFHDVLRIEVFYDG